MGRKVQPGACWLLNLLIAGNFRHAHQGGENIGFGFGFMGVFLFRVCVCTCALCTLVHEYRCSRRPDHIGARIIGGRKPLKPAWH